MIGTEGQSGLGDEMVGREGQIGPGDETVEGRSERARG